MRKSPHYLLLRIALIAALASIPCLPAKAQGCSACRDSAAAAPAKMQSGFRRAIPVLAVPVTALFSSIVWIAVRFNRPPVPGEDSDQH